ncbi:MAG: sigma-70 family RNA polymerase sigma factor [Tepidisphaeraceae bacterium]
MTTRATDASLTFFRPDSLAAADDSTDAALVARLRKGDTLAAEVLVVRYHRPLMGYLRRLGGQAAVAEELHQQTWLSVLQHVSRFDERAGASFKAWLFRIATNKANDLWRRRKHEPAGDFALDSAAAPDAPGRMEAAEQADKLRAAVAKLPEAQRQVVVLRYYGGLKFVEIAETLGCPLNTALGRMHKALIKLRTLMEEESGARKQETGESPSLADAFHPAPSPNPQSL